MHMFTATSSNLAAHTECAMGGATVQHMMQHLLASSPTVNGGSAIRAGSAIHNAQICMPSMPSKGRLLSTISQNVTPREYTSACQPTTAWQYKLFRTSADATCSACCACQCSLKLGILLAVADILCLADRNGASQQLMVSGAFGRVSRACKQSVTVTGTTQHTVKSSQVLFRIGRSQLQITSPSLCAQHWRWVSVTAHQALQVLSSRWCPQCQVSTCGWAPLLPTLLSVARHAGPLQLRHHRRFRSSPHQHCLWHQ